jgi:hypothetical protein
MFQMLGWTTINVSNVWLDNKKCFKCLVGPSEMFQMFGWTIRNVSNVWLDIKKCIKCLVGQSEMFQMFGRTSFDSMSPFHVYKEALNKKLSLCVLGRLVKARVSGVKPALFTRDLHISSYTT